MLDRAKVVDENFVKFVKEQKFPASRLSAVDCSQLNRVIFLSLFESQIISRHIDLKARDLKEKGIGFYTIGSSGHEGNAAIAACFRTNDMAFLHYRSSAFMIQRSKLVPEIDPIRDQLLSLLASKYDPISSGRHKVFGSLALSVPPQTSTIASHLPKAVGTAMSIGRAKALKINAVLPHDSVVLCSFGDASLNHSTAQGAINTAHWLAHQRYPLPIVFICEDNGIGISVPTPNDWVKSSMQNREAIHYIQADGLHLASVLTAAHEAEQVARTQKRPVFLHMKCVRLMGHAGSDIEFHYWNQNQIEANEFQDPLLHSARIAIELGYLSSEDIIHLYENTRERIACAAQELNDSPRLQNADEVMASIIPPKKNIELPKLATEEQRKEIFADQYAQLTEKRTMQQHINNALTDILLRYPNVVMFGEDIAKKGGVYRVTADLQKRFGVSRVFDTLLDEQTILGTAIGMAHNGFLPIPEIQFLAYLHNAEDQIRGEAATLSFFSNGQFTNPMVVRIAGLAYQKGFGGHFHNDNSIAVLRDIPGIIIAVPSNGRDAAKLLRTCVELAYKEQRVVIFIEPIALYMTKDLHEPGDQEWLFHYPEPTETIAFGEVSVTGDDDAETVILTYGNGYYLSRQAEKILRQKKSMSLKIVDIHWLAPLPEQAILQHVAHAKNILIVDECRKTGSVSEALFTLLMEKLPKLPKIKRICGHDSFIPLGDAWKYVLPSRDDIVQGVLDLRNEKSKSKKFLIV